jgi:RNA polymerase sigma factor FliA
MTRRDGGRRDVGPDFVFRRSGYPAFYPKQGMEPLRIILVPTETLPQNDELIESHMALVGHIVRETMVRLPAHVHRDDLTSAGCIALVQAARGFDAERGVPFARYAATRIRGAILDELRSIDWASRSVRRRARDLDETRSRLANALGRVPSDAEVASALGMTLEEIAANDEDIARAQVLSIDGSPDNPYAESLASNTPSPEQMIEHRERLTYMVEAVAELPERLRIVVQEYFLNERPMAEIAETLGVSESRVSQMRAEALVLLKDAINVQLEPELVAAPSRPEGCATRRREAYFAAVAARHAAGARQAQPHTRGFQATA